MVLAGLIAVLGFVIFLWRTGELGAFYYHAVGIHFYKARLYKESKSDIPDTRANSLSRLAKDFGELGPALDAMTNDPSPQVRSRMASSLSGWPLIAANFEDKKKILTALLIAMTEDRDPEVRYSASFGIKQSAVILKDKLSPESYEEIATLSIPYLEKAVVINDRGSGKEYAQEALWIFENGSIELTH